MRMTYTSSRRSRRQSSRHDARVLLRGLSQPEARAAAHAGRGAGARAPDRKWPRGRRSTGAARRFRLPGRCRPGAKKVTWKPALRWPGRSSQPVMPPLRAEVRVGAVIARIGQAVPGTTAKAGPGRPRRTRGTRGGNDDEHKCRHAACASPVLLTARRPDGQRLPSRPPPRSACERHQATTASELPGHRRLHGPVEGLGIDDAGSAPDPAS